MKRMKNSAKAKFILLNIAAALVLFIIIGIIVLSSLENYTRHGHSIPVPAFYSMTPSEAEDVAKHNKLKVEVIDSLYDENAKPGTIVEQYPAADARVKDNRLIHLTINARSPEKIAFPNLQNSAFRQTLQTLETRGFRIGHIEYAPSEFRNLVLKLQYNNQEIAPGTLLPKGAAITIILGSGYGDNTTIVPALAGKNIKDAVSIAQQSCLNIGQIIPDATITSKNDEAKAVVYKQSLGTGSSVTAGSPVTLHITLNQEKIKADTDTLMVSE